MDRLAFLGRLQQVAFHLRQASSRFGEVVEIPQDLSRAEVSELLGIANSLLNLELDFKRIEREANNGREREEQAIQEQTTPGAIH